MNEQFSRTALIYGKDAMERLNKSRVAVFGIGGVGGYVVEALARSGIGELDLIDNDRVCLTNLNRQIIATRKTLGEYKVDVAAERVKDISPDCVVRVFRTFFLPETKDQFDFKSYDYVVDAIDTVTGKLSIIECAKEAGTPVISSMGAGNKIDASAFKVADIYETSVCPLAKVMRRECKKRGIESLKVVYSDEKPVKPVETGFQEHDTVRGVFCRVTVSASERCKSDNKLELLEEENSIRRSIPGSTAFVPAVCGLIIAGEVINDITSRKQSGIFVG
ncbi:MAG: tRNA threonylcarbamoyladenosine dehydratase [Lachnospiraceae bacterium]|nr:tRNA threonylcarbamoyladenosine dehydratase [Lachnospiraceae bacterium]